ncbi:TlpA disulfide reductase family protein [Pontibacter toksunensis]|uniref:TlpA disulfide reductase family protein n=1 Tax=Pontibacter toksunensis TaxID=1332631 RepID=A0ABW6BMI4_9BACT
MMKKEQISLKKVPGWVLLLAAFAVLYVTGLHTEAIGQLQRLMLKTGLLNADVPEQAAGALLKSGSPAIPSASEAGVVGSGFQLTTLDGATVDFKSLKGKVVFLNIWATWCPPCVAEMPNIQRLYEKVGSDKIAFVMLSVDDRGVDKVQKFIQKKGFTFPVYMPAGLLPEEFSSEAIPTTFIISPEGKIVARQEGMAEYDTKEMREFLLSMAK